MGFKFDKEEFDNFVKSVVSFEDKFYKFLEVFFIEMAQRLIREVKPRTPVDTGALRSAWMLGNIEKRGSNLEVEILNGMEYATEIEYGHTIVSSNGVEAGWYEGRFMLKISIENIKKQIPKRFENQFGNFIAGIGL